MRIRAGLQAASVALALSGCATLEPPPRLEPAEAEYAALYPYYVEACAVSQIKKKPGFGADIRGGPGGHAVVYLNGVCREADSATTIGLCDGDSKTGRGAGRSVKAHYKNANWGETAG